MVTLAKKPKATKFQFDYQPRTAEQMRKRATQTGSGRDTFIKSEIKLFNPKEGEHRIRVLPPTWEEAEHFGLEVGVHYSIGPDNAGYLCLYRMKGDLCPICEARTEADRLGEEELAKAYKISKRVCMWVIDRKAEGEGPKVWPMPWTIDRDICAQAAEDDDGAVILLDDPDSGYDVSFRVEGSGLSKKYVGLKIARKPSPLSDEEDTATEWLQYVVDHPLPDCLEYHDYDHIKEAHDGKSSRPDADATDIEAKSARPRPRVRPAGTTAEEAPAATKPKLATKPLPAKKGLVLKKKEPEPEPEPEGLTWEDVHGMETVEELSEAAEGNQIQFDEDDSFETIEQIQDWLCEKLGLTAPAEEEQAPAGTRPSLRDRLSKMGGKK